MSKALTSTASLTACTFLDLWHCVRFGISIDAVEGPDGGCPSEISASPRLQFKTRGGAPYTS